MLRQAVITRQGPWRNTSNLPGESNSEVIAWGNLEETLPDIMEHAEYEDPLLEQAIPETQADNFTAASLFGSAESDAAGGESFNLQHVDWPAANMDTFSSVRVGQDHISTLLDDVSVDYSVDTMPSISETSGVVPISSASDIYSSQNLSSHNLHDRCSSASSAIDNNRRGSCQSIHATISNFFGGPHRAASRVTSTNSVHSELGRSRVEKPASRRSSTRSSGSSGLSCFDSKSDRSSGQVSLGSGRRGPLGKIARATMKMVTAAKACWRCKILRKRCSPETPCDACPKNSHTSEWHTLGCKRGDIKEHMLPVILCPHNDHRYLDKAGTSANPNASNDKETLCNEVALQVCRLRDHEIEDLKQNRFPRSSLLSDFLHATGMDLRSLDALRGSTVTSSSRGRPAPPTPAPLSDCILMIIWELLSNPSSQSLHAEWTIHEFSNFLISAALCQVETGNQLISQSLICLRSCLEALRLQSSGDLRDDCHQTCTAVLCNVTSITNLTDQVSQYLNELSRVFFTKGNMRDIKVWWLNGFYSFCIQSVVRRAIIQLVPTRSGKTWDAKNLAAVQYLQVATRLFVASSRIHDPLVRNLPECSLSTCTEEEMSQINECKLAQISVKQPHWKDNGIKGSGAYLKVLFEDNNQVLLTSTADAGAGSLCPDIDLSFKPYSWLTKFKTIFLVSDCQSMLNSGCWNELSGILSSIMFLVNRYHNYGIELHFANHKSLNPGDLVEGIAPGGYYDVKSIATVTETFKKIIPSGSTLTASRLAELLWPHVNRVETTIAEGEEMKPLNLIVLADSGFKVWHDEVYLSICKKLDEINAPRSQVAIQIFEVGGGLGSETSDVFNEGSKFYNDHTRDRKFISSVSYVNKEQFSGENLLKANLEAWLALLESA
ncbi:hypothetical protein D0Z07_2331 [Hyphodiscus hymeniophilus]|uniref:Uncharacterized protein n=1 Tax=Hyphodiscus hymeniophilus TaxID=353542 RepID=A0A9P6VLZ5_9HELO|nr:hypothetical protein D0Z07_2331 [Hyphodiscus hymeniophilus]